MEKLCDIVSLLLLVLVGLDFFNQILILVVLQATDFELPHKLAPLSEHHGSLLRRKEDVLEFFLIQAAADISQNFLDR